MKVHKYQITAYEGVIDWTHGMGQTQTRLYIPNQGIFAFRSRENIDFFSDDPNAIDNAEKCISGKLQEVVKYLGQIELPDNVIAKAVSAGKKLNRAKTLFQESAKKLVDLVKD